MRNRLISTVGTSLFGNIKAQFNPNLGLAEEQHKQLQAFHKDKNWGQMARLLAQLPPSARVCGAEINSIEEAVKRNRVDLQHLHFLHSDTDEGRDTAKVLEGCFIHRGMDGLQTVRLHQIDELKDDAPSRFKVYGLRNLVRELGGLVETHQPENIVIDATGGYKAQIAIAVVFGQALNIPVLYRHERFSEIIDIPPMPIAFDFALLGENAALLAQFERGSALDQSEVDEVDEKVRVLLEEIEVDGVSVFELGAVGQIYLTAFRKRFPKDRKLKPVLPHEKKNPSFSGDHHIPLGFKEFVQKVCREVDWIKTAHTLPYHKQKSIKGIGFYVWEGKLIGTYVDKDGFGARFEILTSAESVDQLAWAADELNQKYGRS
jgi:putative CRISPR-associated protein (TIGR02619 family)